MKLFILLAFVLAGCGSADAQGDDGAGGMPPSKPAATCPAVIEELSSPCSAGLQCSFQMAGSLARCLCRNGWECGSVESP